MKDRAVKQLVNYGLKTGLITEDDAVYSRNLILDCIREEEYTEPGDVPEETLENILKELLDFACEKGLLENTVTERDLFDTRLMNCLMPRPSEVIGKFRKLYAESPEKATDYFYRLSQDSDYIRRYRIAKDIKWVTGTEYGDLDITINLSKPEKDPKAIAAAKKAKQSGYPKCLLCRENVGYAGRSNHPARENHRIIPITINNSDWYMQYSPYVYYNEHCIVFNGQHVPMKIDEAAFRKLFDFIRQFPHYMLGSNADLPIVGGSILSHDHFQGGRYEFAMAKAPVEIPLNFREYPDIRGGIVKWPLSVIRLQCRETEPVIRLATDILARWRKYTDKAAMILAETDGEPHNTITPIARKKNGFYELDLVLRNNLTTKERPDGLYHPRQELHHIKKENIGLIEVMGLAILPSRLKTELKLVGEYLAEGKDIAANEQISKHAAWAEELKKKYGTFDRNTVDEVLKKEVGLVFKQVLEDAGVYKCTAEGRKAFLRFTEYWT